MMPRLFRGGVGIGLQCDHAVEGVEWTVEMTEAEGVFLLQCDHAVEGVECSLARSLRCRCIGASM